MGEVKRILLNKMKKKEDLENVRGFHVGVRSYDAVVLMILLVESF